MHSKRRYKICIRSVILGELPWVPEVIARVRRGASFRRPQAEDTSGEDLTETGNRAWKASGIQGIGERDSFRNYKGFNIIFPKILGSLFFYEK